MFTLISIICMVISYLVLKNLYKKNWRTREYETVKVKLWQWILVFIGCILPIVNILSLVIIFGTWIFNAIIYDSDYSIRGKYIDKLKNFLNKEI